MKKKMFLLLVLSLGLLSPALFSHEKYLGSEELYIEVDCSDLNCIDEKIYLTTDQVVLSDCGIYILLKDVYGSLVKVQVPQLGGNEIGLYISTEFIPSPQVIMRCPNFHPLSCPKCHGCTSQECPYGCKCRQ